MSYDVSIGKFDRNMTSNCAKQWDLAMPHLNLRDMNGKIGAECFPHLLAGVKHMADNGELYRALDPANNWGDYGSALSFLVQIMFACQENPEKVMRVYT